MQDQAIRDAFKYPYLKNEDRGEDECVDFLNYLQPMEVYWTLPRIKRTTRTLMHIMMRREMKTFPQRVDAATSTLRKMFQDPDLDAKTVHQY